MAMSLPQSFPRFGLLLVALVLMIPCASAWSMQNWAGPANGATLSPGSAVTAAFEIQFDSWTGGTFDSDHSLTLYSDLTNPKWTVTKTVMVNDETPITTQLTSKQGTQIALSGWDLSGRETSFKVNVQMSGTVPALNVSQDILLLRMQEMDEDAKVAGTAMKKTATVAVPTPEPTAAPAITPEETEIVITPEQTPAAPTVAKVISPTKKQTYSPGPDALMICGVLAGFLVIMGMAKRRK